MTTFLTSLVNWFLVTWLFIWLNECLAVWQIKKHSAMGIWQVPVCCKPDSLACFPLLRSTSHPLKLCCIMQIQQISCCQRHNCSQTCLILVRSYSLTNLASKRLNGLKRKLNFCSANCRTGTILDESFSSVNYIAKWPNMNVKWPKFYLKCFNSDRRTPLLLKSRFIVCRQVLLVLL